VLSSEEATVSSVPVNIPADLPTYLRGVVAKHLEITPADLKDGLELGNDLCMDSLAAAELLVVIEENLKVRLPAEMMAGREGLTYGGLVQLICDQVATPS
jgi:acyl carrier protein